MKFLTPILLFCSCAAFAMAITSMNLKNYGTSFRFLVSVDDLNENCTETPETILSDVPWRVRVCRVLEQKSTIYVYVVANITDSTWLIEAYCEYKMFFKGGPRYDSGSTIWLQFNSTTPSHQIAMFYTNKELVMEEALDGKLHFETRIDTKPLRIVEKKPFENFGSKFRVVLKSISQLRSSFYHASSQEVTVRGIRWNILTYQEKKYLMVHLRGNRDDLGLDWSTNVTAKIELLPFNSRDKEIYNAERYGTIEQTFSLENNDHGIQFIKWKKLIDPENIYVLNDSAALLVDIEVGPNEYFWRENY